MQSTKKNNLPGHTGTCESTERMNIMNAWYELINTGLFHHVSTPFIVLVVVFALIVAATVAFAVYEIKHDLS